jgi:hypothetical protein
MKMAHLGALGAIAAVAVGAAIWFGGQGSDGSDARLGERLFPELAARAEEVRTIEIARSEGVVVIQRDGEVWRVPERAGYAADTAKVRQLFVETSALRTLEAKTRSANLYATIEVEDRDKPEAKSNRLSFKDAQGKEVLALLAGKTRYGRGGGGEDAVYVRRAGDAQAWLAKGRLTLARDATQWLDRGVTDIARDRVRVATVTQADGTKIVVSRATPAEKDFSLADLPEGRKAKSSWEINSVAGAFDKLELDDVRKAADVPIPANAPTTVTTTFDGLELTARFVEKDGATWVAITAKAEPPAQLPEGGKDLKKAEDLRAEAEAINKRLGPWVYKLPTYAFDSMRRKLEDLLEPKSS